MPRKLLTPQIKCPSGGDSCKFMTGLYTTENLEIPGCLYVADSMSVSTFEVTQCDVYVGGKVRVSEFMISLDLRLCGSK